VIGAVVAFARTLRFAGLDVTTDRIQSMVVALDHLGVTGTDQVYWAGRLTLCAGPDDIRRYDQAFAAYFLGDRPAVSPVPATVTVVGLAGWPVRDDNPSDDAVHPGVALNASDREVLRHRDVARLTQAERDEVRRLLALLEPVGPLRRSRRFAPARRGPIDAQRSCFAAAVNRPACSATRTGGGRAAWSCCSTSAVPWPPMPTPCCASPTSRFAGAPGPRSSRSAPG
jgi:uncharacterized protein with von Willebrand factor type A (vWA) domain